MTCQLAPLCWTDSMQTVCIGIHTLGTDISQIVTKPIFILNQGEQTSRLVPKHQTNQDESQRDPKTTQQLHFQQQRRYRDPFPGISNQEPSCETGGFVAQWPIDYHEHRRDYDYDYATEGTEEGPFLGSGTFDNGFDASLVTHFFRRW